MLEGKNVSLYEYVYDEGFYIGRHSVRLEYVINKFLNWMRLHPDFDGDWKSLEGTEEGIDIKIMMLLFSHGKIDKRLTTADCERLNELLMIYRKYPNINSGTLRRKVEKYSEFKYL